MNWPAVCAAVIPCLNEQAAVASVVAAVRVHLPVVIVVDDGSTDSSGRLAEQAGAEVLRQPFTRGKGAALQLGWRRASERGFTWAMALDGDGQHSADDIPRFFQCAERTSAHLVVGNRMAAVSAMPLVRRWVNRWMSRKLSRATGQPLPDSQCGFRLLSLDALSKVKLSTTNFEIESEVLLAFAAAKFKTEFVPIEVIYKSEQSKIHPVLDTLRWFRWWRRAQQSFKSLES
jgi:glycosyltransferase involved in cell wall biosynthesis